MDTPTDPYAPYAEAVQAWLVQALPGVSLTHTTALADVLDSLAFLDFFLFLERLPGVSASLDEVAQCATWGQLLALLDTAPQA